MALTLQIPGRTEVVLEHLLLDQNGTLSDRGVLIPGVAERLQAVADRLRPHILTADTFGTLDQLRAELGVEGQRVATGADKRAFIDQLGPERCAAIGNGRNDVEMLEAAALGIVVLGPEGTATAAIESADVVCHSILDALDLLLDERLLVATLRV